MAKSTQNPREFVQKSFSPFIAVLNSPLVDEVCRKNNLSFIELLEPFCEIDKEVSYRDPSSNIVNLKSLRICCYEINTKPPEAAIARRLLNESVSSITEEIDSLSVKSGNITVDIPNTVPWFEKWRETFLKVQFPSDHEFTKHYIACMIVITSTDDNPMDTLSNMVQQLQHMLSMSPPKMIPKWFSTSVLRYYVLLHDVVSADLKKAEKVYEEMKSMYSAQCCYMLQINSQLQGSPVIVQDFWGKDKKRNVSVNDFSDIGLTDSFSGNDFNKIETGVDILENIKSEVMNHPLSPQIENQKISNDSRGKDGNDCVDFSGTLEKPGACLTPEDVERIKTMLSNFVISALIPFVETQMQYLNEMVSNKKGVSKSLFSATKRWFGGPKPGSPVSVPNSHYYHPDSPELQMRRLGDLCFMFGAYNCAFQAYHSAKRDFNSDGAWLYYAGALEMAALSAFLIGLDIKKAQEYTEESVLTYLHTCRMPQFATRITLCATECLKDLGMHGDAAGRLLLMTSEESDLRSALLLEEASYCFIKSKKPFMPRKYAFHLVLAGHRFAKAGQKKHSLRCYRQAYQVYKNKNWSLAEDHIHFTIGKLASALKQKDVTAAEFAKLFTSSSTQLPTQQAAFLKEYFLSLIELQKDGNNEMPFLQIPRIDHSSIKVALNVFEYSDAPQGCTPASRLMSEEEQIDSRWWKLEEKLVSFVNNNSLPISFKPSISIFSDSTNNSLKPVCVVRERICVSVDLVNILNISLHLKKIELLWIHSSSTDDVSFDKTVLAETEIIDSVSIEPDSNATISLHITPKCAGELHITGIKYGVVLQPTSEGADSISIVGYTNLNPRGMRVVSPRETKLQPVYAQDYRLQLTVVESAPCLKVYFKDLPSEIFCGEIQQVQVILQNTGTLSINRVLYTTSEPNLFSVSRCITGSKVFQLQFEPILPGHSSEVTIFLRGRDMSGHTSIDLLFYYDTDKSSHQKLRSRLIYHTLHLSVHESISITALATRSIVINEDDSEVINIRLQVQNKNTIFDSIKSTICLYQVSLFSTCWQLYDVIFADPDVTLNLEQAQVAFVTLKARRSRENSMYSDLILNGKEIILSAEKPYSDFTGAVVAKLNNLGGIEKEIDNNNFESAVAINSTLILFWKAQVQYDEITRDIGGQSHLPLLKFGQKYSSEQDYSLEVKLPETSVPFISSSISNIYFNNPIAKELLLVKIHHPAIVSHSFVLNRICTISVDVIIQNCCDYAVEVKLDTTYQTPNNLGKVNESSLFLWLGVVLHTFVLEQHSCMKMPLSVCVGNSGTYDLGSQLSVSAKKCNSDSIFVAQSSVPRSLLCVSNDVL